MGEVPARSNAIPDALVMSAGFAPNTARDMKVSTGPRRPSGITIESREHSAASLAKRQRISKAGTK